MSDPLRRVVGTRSYTNMYCRPGEGSRVHDLECGHEVRTKQSAGFQKRKRCSDCAHGFPVRQKIETREHRPK